MSLTPSTMLPLGTPMPHFALPDTIGRVVRSDDLAGRPVLVMFLCNHCPYVKHVAPQLARIGQDYADRLAIVAINSNDANAYPDDAPDKMAHEKQTFGYPFPYLHDATQHIAHAFTAACTPDFFLFDHHHQLAYRGELDDTRPHRVRSGLYDDRDGSAHGKTLRHAIDDVLLHRAVTVTQRPATGCNIKWKPGNAPHHNNT